MKLGSGKSPRAQHNGSNLPWLESSKIKPIEVQGSDAQHAQFYAPLHYKIAGRGEQSSINIAVSPEGHLGVDGKPEFSVVINALT